MTTRRSASAWYDRRGAALAAIWLSVARFQPRPCDTSGETLIVKPGRLKINNARRQDLASHAPAGAEPSSWPTMASTASGPAIAHRHQPAASEGGSAKSRAATGWISARRRLIV
jgi:hypothetical protein